MCCLNKPAQEEEEMDYARAVLTAAPDFGNHARATYGDTVAESHNEESHSICCDRDDNRRFTSDVVSKICSIRQWREALVEEGALEDGVKCRYGHQWNQILGKCIPCGNGFFGIGCNLTCPRGWYGFQCGKECTCTKEDCHHIYGCKRNLSDCEEGFIGPYCEIPCPYPNYGEDCHKKCHCEVQYCNPKHGCIDLTTRGIVTFNEVHNTNIVSSSFSLSGKVKGIVTIIDNGSSRCVPNEKSFRKYMVYGIISLLTTSALLFLVYLYTHCSYSK
ncbi:uncharacterized protein LOC134233658, partial [Saccostrea cucullata]|uniref:uncharacterized protein LOC134233658 n=1 Tax=Saccostrea cuccullata TaxID=36930 RepID=UPI002ED34BEC